MQNARRDRAGRPNTVTAQIPWDRDAFNKRLADELRASDRLQLAVFAAVTLAVAIGIAAALHLR